MFEEMLEYIVEGNFIRWTLKFEDAEVLDDIDDDDERLLKLIGLVPHRGISAKRVYGSNDELIFHIHANDALLAFLLVEYELNSSLLRYTLNFDELERYNHEYGYMGVLPNPHLWDSRQNATSPIAKFNEVIGAKPQDTLRDFMTGVSKVKDIANTSVAELYALYTECVVAMKQKPLSMELFRDELSTHYNLDFSPELGDYKLVNAFEEVIEYEF